MICGFIAKHGVQPPPGALERMVATCGDRATSLQPAPGGARRAFVSESAALGARTATSIVNGRSVVWQGELYNRAELLRELRRSNEDASRITDAQILGELYDRNGLASVDALNGSFVFAISDESRRHVVLGRDRFGVEKLYYHTGPKGVVFGSTVASVLAHPFTMTALNQHAVNRFLVFGFNPGWDTFYRNVRKLRPGTVLIVTPEDTREWRYWFLSFQQAPEKSIAEYCHDILDLTRNAIRARLADSSTPGIFLSGGMDSSTIAGLTSEIVSSGAPLQTFSYRCRGRSFDESHYARAMATHCRAEHHEVVFEPSAIRQMESMVSLMDEPLCNAGITIATYLLGQEAEGKVERVFSGDGGDELFGGHPVYAADRVATRLSKMPPLLRRPLFDVLRRLPDSDQKLTLTVKLKRFAESFEYPHALGTYRWRIQYGPEDLHKLLGEGGTANGNGVELFDDLLTVTNEADGPDPLSRSLYVDTVTEVDFYLRRMDLVRSFGITPVFPLLDHRLFEYAARIPSKLKFPDAANSKYIQHRAMAGVLPDEIVHRKDKLGHSIPFKNWLRIDETVKGFVHDALFNRGFTQRGLADGTYVTQLWNDHQQYRRNNSHRLWTLAVLELWLRAKGL